MIEHILERYHRRHREQFSELIHLARSVEQRHTEHEQCPAGIAEQLCALEQALESHMRKEEQVLFPLIARAGAGTQAPIAVMRMEHGQHRATLSRLAELAHGMVPPADASGTWRVLYAGLRAFADDLSEHMRLEDDVLFENALAPRAGKGAGRGGTS
ncbi:MAG TPA: hemerythrin domain-containing protein [Burkholderiales bacterium]|nr:hemerythrin domain-containing protein [Burkholderiales bacterium]